MNTYETALKWQGMGIATLPILAHSKSPALDSWKPYMSRLPTLRELKMWFARPGYGLGLVLGWNDLIVIDWDDAWLYSQWLASQNGAYPVISKTYRVKTRRGVHLYFKCQNVQGWKGHGVDVKAAGGYVLAPPTIHPSGHRYVGIGNIENIQHIQAITDLLPEYQIEMPRCQNASVPKRATDPFDAAMQNYQSAGISVEDLKARVSWADILPGIADVGKRTIKILCPVHDEKTPSFVIYSDGRAKCYGCGFWGDQIDLWAKMHGLTVGEAMADLADRFL